MTGLLAEPENVVEVAEYLLQLLRDPARAQRLGRGNRDWAEHLTWKRFAGEQRAIYEQAVTAWSRGGSWRR